MPLPHNALVLVADGRKMLFFRNHGDKNQIDLRTEAHDARRDRKDRDIKTDAPGTTRQARATDARPTRSRTSTSRRKTAGPRRPPRSSTSGASQYFEALAIVAPPKVLGVLRKELHKEVERRIVCTVNKEMTDRPIPDIEALLNGQTSPEELPAV